MIRKFAGYVFLTVFYINALSGCVQTVGPASLPNTSTDPATPVSSVDELNNVQNGVSDDLLAEALDHFNRGNYGAAEKFYRHSLERNPKQLNAWLGLAASYDRLGRFDLADRAYESATKLAGETADILNNRGFSYLMRGDHVRARRKLLQAQALEPDNPTIAANLKLTDNSRRVR